MRGFVVVVETGLLCVAQDGLELAILYPQPFVSYACNNSQFLLCLTPRVGHFDKEQVKTNILSCD